MQVLFVADLLPDCSLTTLDLPPPCLILLQFSLDIRVGMPLFLYASADIPAKRGAVTTRTACRHPHNHSTYTATVRYDCRTAVCDAYYNLLDVVFVRAYR